MPNYCDYTMKVVGKRENVEKLVKYLNAGYSYVEDGENYPWCTEENREKYSMRFDDGAKHLYTNAEKHFWRVFDAIDEYDFDGTVAWISGYCAWSVYCCMLGGPQTYSQVREDDKFLKLKTEHSTTMEEATKELDLVVEIFSCEPGMGFAEHYVIDNGEVTTDENFDYHEFWLDKEKSKQECEAELKTEITDEEWENNDYIIRTEINPYDPEWTIGEAA